MDKNLIKKALGVWMANYEDYEKMYDYYQGKTDIDTTYTMQTDRSNLKVKVNYIKKFIREEVSYSLGNDITYISKSDNGDVTNFIDMAFENLSEQHDTELAKTMLIFNLAYELYYIDSNKNFSTIVLSPLEAFEVKDSRGIGQALVRAYEIEDNEGKSKINYDVYTKDGIYHLDEELNEITQKTINVFSFIPYGVCKVGKEGIHDTIFNDIKGLQDAYENNLSDLCNEIADFRNAYLILTGAQIDKEDAKDMKKLGVMQLPGEGKASWLIKDLNDSFIQNTLGTLEDKMYQLTNHINHNEKMQSNLSGVALRSRLISLEEKCKINQRALADCIKKRLMVLFDYNNRLTGSSYDWRDIKILFTPNIPQDDVSTADLIAKIGDKLSLETALSRLSFIENPKAEADKVRKQQQEMLIENIEEVDVIE